MGGGLDLLRDRGLDPRAASSTRSAAAATAPQLQRRRPEARRRAWEQRVERNPRDAAGWAALTTVPLPDRPTARATTRRRRQYTDKGPASPLGQAASAWDRYLALEPAQGRIPTLAQPDGAGLRPRPGCSATTQATAAQEVVIDAEKSHAGGALRTALDLRPRRRADPQGDARPRTRRSP